MVVAFDSQCHCDTVANVNYSGILAWTYKDVWGLRWQAL
jgi:hypothetical protein